MTQTNIKQTEDVAVLSGQKIYLRNVQTNKTIKDPVKENSYPCGNVGDTNPGEHMLILVTTGSGDQQITDGSYVRIRTDNETAAGPDMAGYNNLYSSNKGWGYYDQESENDKQKWMIRKTGSPTNSGGDTICIGDQVEFQNAEWPDSLLYVDDNDDYKWLACDSGYPGTWVIEAVS